MGKKTRLRQENLHPKSKKNLVEFPGSFSKIKVSSDEENMLWNFKDSRNKESKNGRVN